MSNLKKTNESSNAVSVKLYNPETLNHDTWTRAGLKTSSSQPSWFLSLRELVFCEVDEIGQDSFGTVYKGS